MLVARDPALVIRIGIFIGFVVGLGPIFRRVWATRGLPADTPRLRYDRMEVEGIAVFLLVAACGIGLVIMGAMHLGAGLVLGSLVGGGVAAYAHIMRKLYDG